MLRARPGDPCEIVFPGGPPQLYAARFAELGEKVRVRLEEALETPPERLRVLLVQALPALPSVDAIVEKGTETGVAEFLVFSAAGSPGIPPDRLSVRLDRWRRLAREAAKQSKQPAVPDVAAVASLEEALALVTSQGWLSLVFDPGGEVPAQTALPAAVGTGSPADGEEMASGRSGTPGEPARVALWIGPEGGWTAAERERLTDAGLVSVRLGHRILRAETAGPVVAALAHFLAGDQ